MKPRQAAGRSLRSAAVAATTVAALSACNNDGPDETLAEATGAVVAIVSQRCTLPNRAHGLGVVVGDDLVVTAGHTVEGDLRSLTVDGIDATVVLIDRNTDLALVRAPLAADGSSTDPMQLSPLRPSELELLGPTGPADVTVEGRTTLVVEHLTDRETYRRDVIVFEPGVAAGTSGAPLVDGEGRLAGVVILNDDEFDQGIAVSAGEVAELLGAAETETAVLLEEPPGSC